MEHTDSKFRHVPHVGVSHLKTLMAVCSSWFLHEDSHRKWSWNVKEMRALTKLPGVSEYD